MKSLRSSPVLPLASALQVFIFSCCVGFLAERHFFMNALRSSPFISPASLLQVVILLCCLPISGALADPPIWFAIVAGFAIGFLIRRWIGAAIGAVKTGHANAPTGAGGFQEGVGRFARHRGAGVVSRTAGLAAASIRRVGDEREEGRNPAKENRRIGC